MCTVLSAFYHSFLNYVLNRNGSLGRNGVGIELYISTKNALIAVRYLDMEYGRGRSNLTLVHYYTFALRTKGELINDDTPFRSRGEGQSHVTQYLVARRR